MNSCPFRRYKILLQGGLVAAFLFFILQTATALEPLTLKPMGPPRQLPDRLLGIQGVTAFYEDILSDPRKVEPAKELAPALIRFPGGTIGNYYNWRTGLLEVPVFQNSSIYTRYMAKVAQGTNRMHPQGIFLEDMAKFSRQIGAEIVLVPNLETSTVEDQAAWFKHLKEAGLAPRHIELGNEFWIAMIMDPNVLSKFPDAATTMDLIERYQKAIKPYLPEDAVFAVQYAGSGFHTTQAAAIRHPLLARMKEWDEDLPNRPWYQALTVHFYPEIDEAAGPGASRRLSDRMDRIFPAMMARVDQGISEALSEMEDRFPGKEIWVTEWNANGVRFLFEKRNPGLTGLMIHLTARMTLTFLKHPAVTVSTYHMLSYNSRPYSVFTPKRGGEGFAPAGPAVALRWFNEAANGGVSYQNVAVDGGKRIPGGGAHPEEGYADVAAAFFMKGGQATLMVHNADPEARTCRIADFMQGRKPARVETFDTPDPSKQYVRHPPEVRTLPTETTIQVPGLSLTRVLWD